MRDQVVWTGVVFTSLFPLGSKDRRTSSGSRDQSETCQCLEGRRALGTATRPSSRSPPQPLRLRNGLRSGTAAGRTTLPSDETDSDGVSRPVRGVLQWKGPDIRTWTVYSSGPDGDERPSLVIKYKRRK